MRGASRPFFVPVERLVEPVAQTAVGTGEGVDAVDLFFRELEVEDVEILLGPVSLRSAGDGDDVLLDQPAQGDLSGGLAVRATDEF